MAGAVCSDYGELGGGGEEGVRRKDCADNLSDRMKGIWRSNKPGYKPSTLISECWIRV